MSTYIETLLQTKTLTPKQLNNKIWIIFGI
jgi:hypothetical protein